MTLADSSMEKLEDDERPAARSIRPAAPKKVLVVDDEPDAVETMAAILREDGHLVDTSPNAEEAMERFRLETYHLLLTDLLLPGKSGVDLTKIIHENCPATAIVLITGHATVKTA